MMSIANKLHTLVHMLIWLSDCMVFLSDCLVCLPGCLTVWFFWLQNRGKRGMVTLNYMLEALKAMTYISVSMYDFV